MAAFADGSLGREEDFQNAPLVERLARMRLVPGLAADGQFGSPFPPSPPLEAFSPAWEPAATLLEGKAAN